MKRFFTRAGLLSAAAMLAAVPALAQEDPDPIEGLLTTASGQISDLILQVAPVAVGIGVLMLGVRFVLRLIRSRGQSV